MEENTNSSRNLMILYAVVGVISLAGASLNFIQVYNLGKLKQDELSEHVIPMLSKGFYIIASLYMIILLISVWSIIKQQFFKTRLIILAVFLIAVFVFGPYIFDIIVGDSTLDINIK